VKYLLFYFQIFVYEWTQIFSGKASEPETSRTIEKRNFTYPTCLGSHRIFVDIFCIIKLESLDYYAALFS